MVHDVRQGERGCGCVLAMTTATTILVLREPSPGALAHAAGTLALWRAATAPTQAARHAASMAAVWECDYRLQLNAAESTTGCGAMRFRCLAGRSPHSCGRVTLGDCLRCVGRPAL